MRKKYILFDLDGTLTDSSEGITKSVQYALDKLGITENDEAVLKRYIGPPLDESFAKFHGLSREDALKAVNYYRERYKDTGIYENRLFDGIKELLSSLKKEGYITALATCKPEIYVPVSILELTTLLKSEPLMSSYLVSPSSAYLLHKSLNACSLTAPAANSSAFALAACISPSVVSTAFIVNSR